MIFGNKSPVTGVCRIVAVVTHHPVVVHLEGILVGFLAVDVDSVRLDLQFVTFVGHNTALIDRQIVLGQSNGSTFGRYPDRTVVVAVPLGV